jgi:hypothetical protein
MNTVTEITTLALRFGKARKVFAVQSLAEASEYWTRFRDAQGLASSESPSVSVINTATGNTVATISYNGRIWGMDGEEIEP